MRLAREVAEKALALDSQYAPALARLAGIAIFYDRDMRKAAGHLEQALLLEPANTDVIAIAAVLSRRLGRWDQAIALGEYLVSRDPVNDGPISQLGLAYMYAGRLDEALAALRTADALNPGALSSHGLISEVLLAKGDAKAALAEAQEEPEDGWRLTQVSTANHALGHGAESDAALAELVRKHAQSHPAYIATALAFRGEADGAFVWLDKAADYHDPSLGSIIGHPFFANIHDDPRWLAFLRKQDMAPEQLAAIKFDVKVPK
jgi:tetratricopeptide (TPR) repeat protein